MEVSTICYICGKTFSNVYTLNAHKRQVHENKKPFKCKICSTSFATKVSILMSTNMYIQMETYL